MVSLLFLATACGGDGSSDGSAAGGPVGETTSTAARPAVEVVEVQATWQSPPDQPAGEPCESTEADCTVTLGTATYTGTFAGTSEYRSESWPSGDGHSFTTRETFMGEVEGCGEGTIEWTLEGTITGAEIEDTWTVVAGSGTAALAGVTGEGAQEGQFAADLSYTGTMTGTIRCGPQQ
jgi:hypothetical protein